MTPFYSFLAVNNCSYYVNNKLFVFYFCLYQVLKIQVLNKKKSFHAIDVYWDLELKINSKSTWVMTCFLHFPVHVYSVVKILRFPYDTVNKNNVPF